MVLHFRRPLNSTYADNYRYGSSLYSGTVDDAEKRYRATLSRTHVRSDRGDLGLYSFAGSNIHGGVPPASVTSASASPAPKSTTRDLYAPLDFGYGRNYYNSLRAESPKPRKEGDRTTKRSYDYYTTNDDYTSSDLKTHSAKSSTTYDDLKKTVTTTTTTERWVPLTSYLYSPTYYHYSSSTPYSRSYKTADDYYHSYLDDYNKTTTTTSKSRNLDALDLSLSSSYNKLDYNHWMEKCREIQTHLDQVNHWVADADSKIKNDVVGARNKMQTELTEVALLVEDTTKYNEELQRVIRRQAKQITDLHSQYDDINRHLADVSDMLEKSRARCQNLQAELTSVQTALELSMRRK